MERLRRTVQDWTHATSGPIPMNSFAYFVLMLAGMLGYAALIYRVLCRSNR